MKAYRRSIAVVMCAGPLLWVAGVDAKEFSPRDIYEQASPAVVMTTLSCR